MGVRKLNRRDIIRAGAVTGIAGVGVGSGAAAGERQPTLPATEGPFYPVLEQTDTDADLTQFGGSAEQALGEIVLVEGRVVDVTGAPIESAIVDIWQANAAGRYAHEKDPNPAPLDPNFQSWAIMTTDADGRYGFKTVKPGAYPAESDWTRPPHIHFKVGKRGFRELTTQMYFAGDPLNEIDRLLNEVPQDRRADVVAESEPVDGDPDANKLYRFDIVLAKV